MNSGDTDDNRLKDFFRVLSFYGFYVSGGHVYPASKISYVGHKRNKVHILSQFMQANLIDWIDGIDGRNVSGAQSFPLSHF